MVLYNVWCSIIKALKCYKNLISGISLNISSLGETSSHNVYKKTLESAFWNQPVLVWYEEPM